MTSPSSVHQVAPSDATVGSGIRKPTPDSRLRTQTLSTMGPLGPGTSTAYATLRPSGDGLTVAILATGATVPALATSARFSPFASTLQRSIPVIALPGPPPSVNKRDMPSGSQAKSTTRRPASGVTTAVIAPLRVSSTFRDRVSPSSLSAINAIL